MKTNFNSKTFVSPSKILLATLLLLYGGGFSAFSQCCPLVYRPYCIPTSNPCGSSIQQFSIKNGADDNLLQWADPSGFFHNTLCQGANYSDKTNSIFTPWCIMLKHGNVYRMDIVFERLMGVGVWIDLNDDLDFDDFGEMVCSVVPSSVSNVIPSDPGSPVLKKAINLNVVIPPGSSPAFHRMRVRAGLDINQNPIAFSSNQWCTPIPFGETEDHLVHVDIYPSANSGSNGQCIGINTISFGNATFNTDDGSNLSGRSKYYPGQSLGIAVPVVKTGSNSPLSVNCSPFSNQICTGSFYGAWIDFNNNLSFDDAGDFVGFGTINGTPLNIAIPANAAFIGNRRMRIRKNFASPPSANMSSYKIDGMTTDLTITIKRSYGTIPFANQNMCPPADPSVIAMSDIPLGNVVYNWYYKDGIQSQPVGTPDATWNFIQTANPITGATYPTYDPPAGLTTTRTYACYITPKIMGAFPSGWAQGVRQIRVKSGYCFGRMAVSTSGEENQSDVALSQNFPNPFTAETSIPCFIPEGTQSASLEIYGMDGRKVYQIKLSGTREQHVTIKSSMLPASGIYLYTLEIDGQKQPMQRMVLAK